MKVRTHSPLSVFSALVASAFLCGLASGCHEDSRPSPTAPGPATSSISGTLVEGTGTAGMRSLGAGNPLIGVTVTLVATGQVARTDAAGNFGFRKVLAGAVQLRFERSDIHASLTLNVPAGSTVTVTIAVRGSTATVVSSGRGNEREVHGTIKSIDAGGKSFILSTAGGDVTVHTDATTEFKRNGHVGFSALVVGDQVEVEGTGQTDGSILARKVDVKMLEENEVEVTGTIQSINPAAKSFVLMTLAGPVTVRTDGTTVFKRRGEVVAFSALAVGAQVEVEGARQPDGSILARKVGIEELEENEAEVTGTIQSINSAAHSFVLMTPSGSVTVHTDASTLFKDSGQVVGFSALAVGARVEVEGTRQPDGSILARKVNVED